MSHTGNCGSFVFDSKIGRFNFSLLTMDSGSIGPIFKWKKFSLKKKKMTLPGSYSAQANYEWVIWVDF